MSAKAYAIERVGNGADQPESTDQTGSLRVTMQLMSRLERCDRLSVARMRMASSVTLSEKVMPPI